MIYKRMWVVLLIFVATSMMWIGGAVAQEATKVYTDQDNGFSISYPTNWMEGELEGALIWFYDEETSSEIIVIKEEIPEGFTAKQYADAVGEWLKSNVDDYSEESLTESTLSGVPSFTRIYSFSFKGENSTISIKTVETYAVKDNYGFAILCDTKTENFSSMEELFRKVTESFKFTEKESN